MHTALSLADKLIAPSAADNEAQAMTDSRFRFLTHDEAAFIAAACSRVLDLEDSKVSNLICAAAAPHVDRHLVGEPSLHGAADPLQLPRSALYRAGIAAVQAYCLRTYDARFQCLEPGLQDATLALVEEGRGFGGIGQFQMLTSMLVADAVDAYFEASNASQTEARKGATRLPVPTKTSPQEE
jgi:hypothetical protein